MPLMLDDKSCSFDGDISLFFLVDDILASLLFFGMFFKLIVERVEMGRF